MELGSKDIELVVMTVDRSPQYIHQTLASLFASDRLIHDLASVRLMVGCENAAYLDAYRHHPNIRIEPMSAADWKMIQDWHIHRRLCFNYWRCLSLGSNIAGLCICEDDIVFCSNFVHRLLATIEEIEQTNRDFALSLYSPYDMSAHHLRRGHLHVAYRNPYYGAQCMYYPHKTANVLAEFMWRKGVVSTEDPSDLLISRFAQSKSLLFAPHSCLVQHMGQVSTGVAGFMHRSKTFGRHLKSASSV